jgi:SAM-dependent methyltransferase
MDIDLTDDDAFGALLVAEYEDRPAWEIIERDDAWFGPGGDPEAYFLDYGDWNPRAKTAMAAVSGRVLDVGCGGGRHLQYCRSEGYDATGIDVSPGAVAVCQDRGLDARVCDVADVAGEFEAGAFDTVLMMGNNFGLVGTRDTASDRLESLATVTTDDATLLAESMDPAATDEQQHLDYHEHNRERGRLPGALRMRVRYGTYASDWFDYLLASPDTMRDLAADTPWTVTDVLDTEADDDGSYVAILEKTQGE